jgi:predicted GIY-YIG superfamily endonuclease
MSTLYILQLEDDKWYVGKTDDVHKRFQQHLNGKGSIWTKQHTPNRIIETRPITSIHDETNVTKDLMKKYGIDNVRGGAYCQTILPEHVIQTIKHELNSGNDKCYNCGMKGHFANNCPSINQEESPEEVEVWGCSHCSREFDSLFGAIVHERSCKTKNVQKQQSTSCYRCGRPGHYSPECYARTHKNGYTLDN